jgi:azurin
MIADGKPDEALKMAVAHDGHLVELLRSVPSLGKAEAVRAALVAPISALVAKSADPALRAEAVAALGWTRRDAESFRLLAREVTTGTEAGARGAAIRSLTGFPESAWPKDEIEPLARALVAFVKETETNRRTESPALEALQFGERLASALPGDTGRAIRRDLRGLGVRVVRIETIPEQMKFDLNWFAVEAGKPVQIVLVNPDAMPHNLLVTQPGSLQEVGTAAASVPMSSDPKVKPFVPDTPLVLEATRLVQQGETEALGFTAPKEPGEYVFLCSFPGHWLRMYGVMLVVPSLEAWEAAPSVPTDPMTKKPFASER